MWHFLNHFRKLFEFFPQEGVPRTMLLQKRSKRKEEEWQINNEKNIEKHLRSRLLDFLLFDIKGNHKQY